MERGRRAQDSGLSKNRRTKKGGRRRQSEMDGCISERKGIREKEREKEVQRWRWGEESMTRELFASIANI